MKKITKQLERNLRFMKEILKSLTDASDNLDYSLEMEAFGMEDDLGKIYTKVLKDAENSYSLIANEISTLKVNIEILEIELKHDKEL